MTFPRFPLVIRVYHLTAGSQVSKGKVNDAHGSVVSSSRGDRRWFIRRRLSVREQGTCGSAAQCHLVDMSRCFPPRSSFTHHRTQPQHGSRGSPLSSGKQATPRWSSLTRQVWPTHSHRDTILALAGLEHSSEIAGNAKRASSAPDIIPVLVRPTKSDLAAAKTLSVCRITAPSDHKNDALAEIDHRMELRLKAREGERDR